MKQFNIYIYIIYIFCSLLFVIYVYFFLLRFAQLHIWIFISFLLHVDVVILVSKIFQSQDVGIKTIVMLDQQGGKATCMYPRYNPVWCPANIYPDI